MSRGLAAVADHLTVVVNVADDETVYGVHVSPDVDTVLYTLAGLEGPQGWGVAGDTFTVLGHLDRLGAETAFRLGDADLALNLLRTAALRSGEPLSRITARLAGALGVEAVVLPVTDDPLRTRIRVAGGAWLAFQEYFVLRGHRDDIEDLRFEGADAAVPAPGVIDAIADADVVVIGPSNPPLSIWPLLVVPGVRAAVAARRIVAVSPLFGGRPLKGPADRAMAALGLPGGNEGVAAAYDGLLDVLVVDQGDAADVATLARPGLRVVATDTRIAEPESARRFATWLLETAG